MNISEQTLTFLREQYERNLDDWFDDPDEQFTGWTHAEFLEWYNRMVAIGNEIGTPFWKVAERGHEDFGPSEDEIDRVKAMLRAAGAPVNQNG
jgi:hypothetical protein